MNILLPKNKIKSLIALHIKYIISFEDDKFKLINDENTLLSAIKFKIKPLIKESLEKCVYSNKFYLKVIKLAVVLGDIEIFKLCQIVPFSLDKIFNIITKSVGNFDFFLYLLKIYYFNSKGERLDKLYKMSNIDDFIPFSCKIPDIRLLKYLHQEGYKWYYDCYEVAFEFDNTNAFTYLLDNLCPDIYNEKEIKFYKFVKSIIIKDAVECLKILIKRNQLSYDIKWAKEAVKHSCFKILKYFVENENYTLKQSIMKNAINNENINLIKYLLSIGLKLKPKYINFFITKIKDKGILKLYIDNNIQLNRTLIIQWMQMVLRTKKLYYLKYFLDNNLVMNLTFIQNLIEMKNKTLFNYLVDNKFLQKYENYYKILKYSNNDNREIFDIIKE